MMFNDHSSVGLLDRPGPAGLSFEASDVTGTQSVSATDVAPEIPAGDVARALAERMALPSNVPWTLRDDASAGFLDESIPIGDQISDRASVTLTPKTHLG